MDDGALKDDVRRLGRLVGDTLRQQAGPAALELVDGLRRAAIDLRRGVAGGGQAALGQRLAELPLQELGLVARAFTQFFHLMNAAEEQHRVRVLRSRDRPGQPPEGSIAAAVLELRRQGTPASEVRALLGRLLVMPVLTAHPTEARRRTMIDHLARVAVSLDQLDDPRSGARQRAELEAGLRETVLVLFSTEEARAERPAPIDEVRAVLDVFDRTLLEVTPLLYGELEDALAAAYPGESLPVPPFLRWGSWVGGDRDGHPGVTASITRQTLERQRAVALGRHLRDLDALGRELSSSLLRVSGGSGGQGPALAALLASTDEDRQRLPEVARQRRRPNEPWRDKLAVMRARLSEALVRGDARYLEPDSYRRDLQLLADSLTEVGLEGLARGQLRQVRRRAEVFGFHLCSLDLRQHSDVHEKAVSEVLAAGGVAGYDGLDEAARQTLLAGLLERAHLELPRDPRGFSPATRELLATLEGVGWQRRDIGPQACERYVVSFTRSPSDLLEVLLLARAARLLPDELRPVPLLEQLEDLEAAAPLCDRLLELGPVRTALGGELEVMIGYSDSGKQVGTVASQVALQGAQEGLAQVADSRGVMLTVFHGRGGAVGRGGGPASRAIMAQPPRALRGRLRVTEQGETIAARYGRPDIARRDLEQMISAVILGSVGAAAPASADSGDRATLERAARASQARYQALIGDRDRLARYALAATPIEEVSQLPIASRPSRRPAGGGPAGAAAALSFEELRAIPWVFSWNQSRHGIPGWFGLGSALAAIAAAEGPDRGRALYQSSAFFRALIDNAQLALVRADMDIAACYAGLAGADAALLFELIREEHDLTVTQILQLTGEARILASSPTIARTVERRNPYVDVLNHAQVELLGRLRAARAAGADEATLKTLQRLLFVTINGIAAGLQTAG